jgi:serine/threonine protein kinase
MGPPGREAATGRKIAIKKIKLGEFKDGLDMSAVREVKYLSELRHPNIIEVRMRRAAWRLTRPLTYTTSRSSSMYFLPKRT